MSRIWGFPKVNHIGVSPPEIKAFSGQSVAAAHIFFADYGYIMGTLNSQIHFKTGNASLKGKFPESFGLIHPAV